MTDGTDRATRSTPSVLAQSANVYRSFYQKVYAKNQSDWHKTKVFSVICLLFFLKTIR
jgi:hypothetical protein